MHERQAIREAIVTALTNETAADDRVFKTRLAPLPRALLPAISVYTQDEETEPASKRTAPRELKRTVTVGIDAWCSAKEDVDDALDDLALEIEAAMDEADQGLGGTAFDCVLARTEVGFKTDGDRPMGCVHLEYEVTYHTELRVVAPTDDFDTASVSYLADGVDEDDQREDLVDGIHE